MSISGCSSSTTDDRLDTWSSCNVSLDFKKQIIYELPPFYSNCYSRSRNEQECLEKVWNVQHLSSEQAPKSFAKQKESSNLIQKKEHEVALQNFKTELGDLHKSCDSKIQELERNTQIGIDKLQDDIENEKRDFCQIACVDDEKYECLECKVDSMLSQEKTKIDEFGEQIRVIEKERQSNALKIFKKFFQIVKKLCYVPISEHKRFFEKEIAIYNQTVLENNKNYEKTKLKFRLSIDVLKQNFHSWLKDVKDDRMAVCRKNALDDFYYEYEKFNNAGFIYSKKCEGKTALSRLNSMTTVVSCLVSQWDLSIPFPTSRFDDQVTAFNSTMNSTDATITSFIRSYKFYFTNRLGKLLCKAKKLRSIVEMMEAEEETEDEELTIVEDICDKAKKEVDDFIAKLETNWSDILQTLNDKAKEVFKIFINFGSPWDVLSAAFLKQQDTVAQQLDNRASKSKATHSDLQQKILVEVPKLREEENIPKLEKKLTQVMAILEKRVQKCKSDYDEDCKIIKKATEFMQKEVGTMAIKVDKFLDANKSILDEPPKDNDSTVTSYESGQSDNCFEDFQFEEIVMHDFELIENQIEVLDEWKLNLLKNMISYRPSFEKEIMEVVELWQDNLISEAYQCLQTNLKSIEELGMDIRRDVYDVRYNELIRHQEELKKHTEMINQLLNNPTECMDKLLTYSDIIKDYKLDMSQMLDEQSRNTRHSSQLQCFLNMLKTLKKCTDEKIDKRMNANIERLMKKISMITSKNDSFFGEMIPFSNGGTYSSEELNLAKKEMAILIKNIQKDESTNRITITKITDQALQEINEIDKINTENVSITLEKLKMQEEILSATKQCKQRVSLTVKEAIKMNQEMVDTITLFIQMCQNKAEVNEVMLILNETINKVLETLELMKGPFPEIDIPQELESTFYNAKNNVPKNGNSKKREMSVKSLVNEPTSNVEDNKSTNNGYNFPSAIGKYITDAIATIKSKAMNYYTVLINKKDELPFTDQNSSCENCINCSLQKLNVIYLDMYKYWIEAANCISKFFETLEMPSIEWYLRDDDDKTGSIDTLSTMGSDPNQYVSNKFNENMTGIQSTLQEMLGMLQLKHTNGSSTNDECEDVQ